MADVSGFVGIHAAVQDCGDASARKLETDERASRQVLVGDKIDFVELDPIKPPATEFTSGPEGGECGGE